MEEEKNVINILVPNLEILNSLEEYNCFLRSIFVNKLKSITTIDGYTNIVSVNALEQIHLKDEICMLINSIIIKLPCFSVYSGIVMSTFLIKVWSELLSEYSINNIILSLLEVQQIFNSLLDSMKIECKTINIKFLQNLVIPMLMSEPSIWLDQEALQCLSLQIVKAILSITGEDNDVRLGHVNVHVEEGKDNFFVINGVLCEVDDANRIIIESDFLELPPSNKIVLFSENLDFSEKTVVIVEEIIDNNVKAIACQKKISDFLKIILRRKKVLIIERIGLDTARCLEQSTGAIAIRDLENFELGSISTVIGLFSNINLIASDRKNVISIETAGSSVSSLYVQCRVFSDPGLIKKLINSCILLIRSVIASPFDLPGPVSFESLVKTSLKKYQTNNIVLQQIINTFINILEEMSVLYEKCGFHKFDSLVDCYHLKRNAFLHTFEGIISTLNIGQIVRKL